VKNITDTFLESLLQRTGKKLSREHDKKLKNLLLDYLGVAYAGSVMLKENHLLYLEKMADVTSHSSLFGIDGKCSIQLAAMLNGMSAHAPEMDDGVRFGNYHPGASIISALLAVAEKENMNAEHFFKGMMAGYEASVNLAIALQPSHKKRGFHTTATCGVIGSAIGVAVMLNYSIKELKTALTLAVTSSSGLLEATRDHSNIKPFHTGKAASNGITAAYLAVTGYQGGDDVLGGKEGFFHAMSDEELPAIFLDEDVYAIDLVYLKPYAACRHAHPAIEAALLIRKSGIDNSQTIQAIDIETYDIAIRGHNHKVAHDTHSAKMSTPFSVAAALVYGQADLNAFSKESLQNSEIKRLAGLVQIRANEVMSRQVPEMRPARVTIRTSLDEAVTEQVDLPRGEPERPLTQEEVFGKFISLAEYGGKEKRWAETMIDEVINLNGDMSSFFNHTFDKSN